MSDSQSTVDTIVSFACDVNKHIVSGIPIENVIAASGVEDV